MPRHQTTPAGYRRLEKKIRAAHDRYATICATNEEAAGAGDTSVWHDNFAYEENQRQMHAAARTIHDLRALAADMYIVRPPDPPPRVMVGTRVEVEVADGACHTWTIAGFEDGDPAAGRISYTAPLALVLLGAEAGDTRLWRRGRDAVEIEVVSIAVDREEMGT